MGKTNILILIFLLATISSASANEEFIDVGIRIVDLTGEPVPQVWVRIWNETGGEIVSCCAVTANDGMANLRIPGTEGPYIIQAFSFAGVDKPQLRGVELASESRFLFDVKPSSESIYELVVNEANGSKGDSEMYVIANSSLVMARESLDVSNESLKLSKQAFYISVFSIILAIISTIVALYQIELNKPNKKKLKMEEIKQDSKDCPFSVESWLNTLNDEIISLGDLNFSHRSSSLLSFTLAFIVLMVGSFGTPAVNVIAKVWVLVFICLILLALQEFLTYLQDFKVVTELNKIRNEIISGNLVDSNNIRNEWMEIQSLKNENAIVHLIKNISNKLP